MARARPSSSPDPLDRLLGESSALHALRAQICHLARFDAIGNPAVPTVLLQGETGTGKGLVARVIHDSGPRAPGPCIAVNCAAIPDTLLEAELFGVEAGAFTDAKQAKPGLFEAASGGTLFLDEIDALPLALQGKFLTAIEDKQVRRVGAVVEHPVDLKFIAATQVALNGQVLAIVATRPDMTAADALRYEPWTMAEKVVGFGGIRLQDSPALCLVAFGLPQTGEQLPQRAM